ncbi:MAG: NupC/NupG family nucleoside CNT transporter [Bdellovibrionaceae bacterium]|nr:NupC/NupG family nucleoside CNT transporter [Pseudobdellovibrionaceae bacterium]
MERLIPLLGLLVFTSIAYLLSSHRERVNWRLVIWGFGLQFSLCILVLGIPALGIDGPLRFLFEWTSLAINAVLNYTLEGSKFLFGDMMDTKKSGYILALQVLPTIVFMASLMSVLYHLRIMQWVIRGTAWVMQKSMKTSGAETLSAASNIFVGQTEAPLVIKPFVEKMTRSELFCVMSGGMATVAGGVLAAYVGLLRDRIPDIAGHLLTASVLSAPAALLFAKILIPETEVSETATGLPKSANKSCHANVIDAAASGASDGLQLALNVGAMLLAFIALIALVNGVLGLVSPDLTLQMILGYGFSPLAWLMGIPYSEIFTAGSLLGEKVVLNEFFAYVHLAEISSQFSERSITLLSYALCGFANFSSIAIQLGGIGGIAPSRRQDIAMLGMRSIVAGSLACFSTACVVSFFL